MARENYVQKLNVLYLYTFLDLSERFAAINVDLCSAQRKIECLNDKLQKTEEEKSSLTEKVKKLEDHISKYETTANATISIQGEVIGLYKDIVQSGSLIGGLLSLSERDVIREEVKKTKKLFSFGLREKKVTDLADKFDPMLFDKLVDQIREECPTIMNILEQLVISYNTSRNSMKTIPMKLRAAVHLVGALMDVRDQSTGNNIPVLFGLLCLSYGAGHLSLPCFNI